MIMSDIGLNSPSDKCEKWQYCFFIDKDDQVIDETEWIEGDIDRIRTELMAIIKVLEWGIEYGYNEKEHLYVTTTDETISKGINEYYQGWIKRGWKTKKDNKDVKNRDLWERLIELKDLYKGNVSFEYGR